MADMDRSKRYDNSPKAKHGKMQDKGESKAETEVKSAEAKEGAGKGPTDAKPGPVGKVGEDPGPEAGKDSTWGVVAERHKSEHAAMVKRHSEEMGGMAERHGKEGKDMMTRHHKELQDGMEMKAEGGIEGSAGSPPKLGKTESEGKKGSNV